MSNELNEHLDHSETLGVIGSPSSTMELTIDILGTAVEKKLVGTLSLFKFRQEGKDNYALGQITDIHLSNIWSQDPTMKSLIKQKGRVDPITERQDTHTACLNVSSVFEDSDGEYEPSMLGTVPATGTPILIADDQVMDNLLKNYKSEMFYLGRVYGSNPKLPMWFKHFDSGPGGAGEAYHLGIFGKTGSGKTVLAKMIMLAYARHKNMGIFVIDPQGEFSKDCAGGKSGGFDIDLKGCLEALGKNVSICRVNDLRFDDWELFKDILMECDFLDRLSIPRASIENRQSAANAIVDRISGKQRWKSQATMHNFEIKDKKSTISNIWTEEQFTRVVWPILNDDSVLTDIYKAQASKDRLKSRIEELQVDGLYPYWKHFAKLFAQREKSISFEELAKEAFNPEKKPLIIIDLSVKAASSDFFWNDNIKAYVIEKILLDLEYVAEEHYKEEKSLNTLVIIDEAHKLASREKFEEFPKLEDVKRILIDAVKTTRKYGLGWMFISQTLSSLHKAIIEQLRISIFGFGLGIGSEYVALQEFAAGNRNAINLYQTFRDPHSTFNMKNRVFPFMSIGPVSPLSFSGTPLFFSAFNKSDDFVSINNLIKKENDK